MTHKSLSHNASAVVCEVDSLKEGGPPFYSLRLDQLRSLPCIHSPLAFLITVLLPPKQSYGGTVV